MSRAYNARRKAKRQQARTAHDDATDAGRLRSRRLMALIPASVIAGILATVGILGFGGTSNAINRKEIQKKVSRLLSGIPQHRSALGSAKAPMTLWIFADLECPTVKGFVTAHLPSIIDSWVRDGTVKLQYRSLKSDTYDERTFYEQEAAALAAGRQNKMWNYALTFILEQGEKHTNYATEEFLADIASQVPGLKGIRWRHDRDDQLLTKRVARDLYSARTKELQFTPSFLLSFSKRGHSNPFLKQMNSVRKEVESSLNVTVDALNEEAYGDVPTFGFIGAQDKNLGGIEVP
jgi:protein-disulfide isomerase